MNVLGWVFKLECCTPTQRLRVGESKLGFVNSMLDVTGWVQRVWGPGVALGLESGQSEGHGPTVPGMREQEWRSGRRRARRGDLQHKRTGLAGNRHKN